MSFQEAVRSALIENYANFTGRALRSEFWYFMLAFVIASLVATAIDVSILRHTILETIVTLAAVLPTLAVGARRLHDIDRSGWWQFIQVIPLIGIIVLIYWFAQPGEPGPNRFGPPLAR